MRQVGMGGESLRRPENDCKGRSRLVRAGTGFCKVLFSGQPARKRAAPGVCAMTTLTRAPPRRDAELSRGRRR